MFAKKDKEIKKKEKRKEKRREEKKRKKKKKNKEKDSFMFCGQAESSSRRKVYLYFNFIVYVTFIWEHK